MASQLYILTVDIILGTTLGALEKPETSQERNWESESVNRRTQGTNAERELPI